MPTRDAANYAPARIVAEAVVVVLAVLLFAAAAVTGPAWVDHHFLPDFFKPQPHRHQIALALRLLGVILGLVLLIGLRPRCGRLAATIGTRALLAASLRIVLAVLLALAAGEAILRTQAWQARHQAPAGREPIQQPHPRLGWELVPSHRGTRELGGRSITTITDAHGYRLPCARCEIDHAAPSLLFAGESIMLGTGLHGHETIPAQVQARLGVQSVNLAVNGYASDQVYLRVAEALPRFPRARAVITLFMPSLLPRNLNRDRPHLDAALRWHPAREPWRLDALLRRLLRYAGTAEIERGVAMTRAALQATGRLAQRRGIVSLVLVPQYPPESDRERQLRQRILDEGGIDYIPVPLDPRWRLSDDDHPDARAARAMAAAVAQRLSRVPADQPPAIQPPRDSSL